MVDDNIDIQRIETLKVKFTSVSLYEGDDKIDEYVGLTVDLQSYVRLYIKRIMIRLH